LYDPGIFKCSGNIILSEKLDFIGGVGYGQ